MNIILAEENPGCQQLPEQTFDKSVMLFVPLKFFDLVGLMPMPANF